MRRLALLNRRCRHLPSVTAQRSRPVCSRPPGADSPEEVNETAASVGRLLRFLAVGWLGMSLYKIVMSSGAHPRMVARSCTSP